jgi:hypothetical protein
MFIIEELENTDKPKGKYSFNPDHSSLQNNYCQYFIIHPQTFFFTLYIHRIRIGVCLFVKSKVSGLPQSPASCHQK